MFLFVTDTKPKFGWRGPRYLTKNITCFCNFSWEEKHVAPLIAAHNGDCTNKKTKDRAKKLDYRLCV
jgi:hypothetical protein